MRLTEFCYERRAIRPQTSMRARALRNTRVRTELVSANSTYVMRANNYAYAHCAIARVQIPRRGRFRVAQISRATCYCPSKAILREGSDVGAGIWASAVMVLPPAKLKFALNAVTDTLPHNRNLTLWRGMDANGRLCGESCPQPLALKLRRYNHCHAPLLLILYGQKGTGKVTNYLFCYHSLSVSCLYLYSFCQIYSLHLLSLLLVVFFICNVLISLRLTALFL